MRGRRLHRLLQLIALLRGPRSWNSRRLAEHFHTSRRNIHRDLAILELAGVPFWYDVDYGEGGGYRIAESFFFPSIGLTDKECLDLAVVTRLAEQQGVPLVDEVCHVRDKLFGTLPAKQQDLIIEASELFDILSVHQEDLAECQKVMLALQKALLAKKQIEASYQSPEEKRPRKVQLQPRRVFLANSTWYLAAHDNKEGQTKLYRLARFRSLNVLDRPLTVSPQFSLREYLGNAWTVHRGERDYHIEVRFSPEAAPFIEEFRYHHTQEVERCPDGAVLFRATVSGLEEVRWWILSWGPKAKVLKPRELVEEVQRLARATLERYQQAPASAGPRNSPRRRPTT